jgi:hypothetical protein
LATHPVSGSHYSADFLVTSSTRVLGDAAARVKRPHFATKLHLVGELAVTSAVDAQSRWAFRITRAEALPFEGMSEEFLAGVTKSLGPVNGASGRFTMLAKGRVEDLEIDTAGMDASEAAARAKMAGLFVMTLSTEWPEQSVGDGARWTVRLEQGDPSECTLSWRTEAAMRCRGSFSDEGDTKGDVEIERQFDRDSGLLRALVTRAFVRMRAPAAGEDMPMETRTETRLEVR